MTTLLTDWERKIQSVPCPECKASLGKPCALTPNTHHLTRWLAYENQPPLLRAMRKAVMEDETPPGQVPE